MANKNKKLLNHEVLDRSSLVLDLFDSSVSQHPVVQKNKKLKKAAQKIINKLYDFYNMASKLK